MQYTTTYQSPLGGILPAGDDEGLAGLWFDGEKYYAAHLDPEHEEKEIPLFKPVKKWLDIYFSGKEPDFMPPIHMTGSDFQLAVWEILRGIPYGHTVTYGQRVKMIAKQQDAEPIICRSIAVDTFNVNDSVFR